MSKPKVLSAADELKRLRRKAIAERHHNEFRRLWRLIPGPTLTEELKFHSERKWRFDFAHEPTKTAIEIEGGVFSGGRHTRGKGFSDDCEKYNAADALGWRIQRLTPDMIHFRTLNLIADLIRQRSGALPRSFKEWAAGESKTNG